MVQTDVRNECKRALANNIAKKQRKEWSGSKNGQQSDYTWSEAQGYIIRLVCSERASNNLPVRSLQHVLNLSMSPATYLTIGQNTRNCQIWTYFLSIVVIRKNRSKLHKRVFQIIIAGNFKLERL